MKERPILFNAEMVKAILSGRKTQTRRVMKTQPSSGVRKSVFVKSGAEDGHGRELVCPLGQPGDQLWVREAIFPAPLEMQSAPPRETLWNIAYRDGQQLEKLAPAAYNPTIYNYERWTPSIHMPRWASRIDLLITGVRAERLNSLTNSDAKAEGYPAEREIDGGSTDPWLWFRDLWDGIYPDNTFKVNPWVWVIEFEHLRAGRKG
ncbi:UNVERIFIED_ORG: hypothetical protein M2414_003329 [Rahnella aquatilis]